MRADMDTIGVILVLLAYLALAWGWSLLGIGGAWVLLRSRRRWKVGSGVPWKTWGCAGLMIAAAIAWENAVRPLTFGRNYPAVSTADGQATAYVRHTGTVNYHLVATYPDDEFELRLHRWRMPKQVFWMYDDTAIGVDYEEEGYQDLILYVGLWHESRRGERELDKDELRKADNYLERELTPEEQQAFDAALAGTSPEPGNL